MSWAVSYTEHAQQDAKKLVRSNLKHKAEELLALIAEDPYASPPRFEKLVGELAGAYSRRLNEHHRLVYQVHEAEHRIKVLRMWTHYE